MTVAAAAEMVLVLAALIAKAAAGQIDTPPPDAPTPPVLPFYACWEAPLQYCEDVGQCDPDRPYDEPRRPQCEDCLLGHTCKCATFDLAAGLCDGVEYF